MIFYFFLVNFCLKIEPIFCSIHSHNSVFYSFTVLVLIVHVS